MVGGEPLYIPSCTHSSAGYKMSFRYSKFLLYLDCRLNTDLLAVFTPNVGLHSPSIPITFPGWKAWNRTE